MCKAQNKTCHVDDEEISQCGSCLFGYQPMDGKCQRNIFPFFCCMHLSKIFLEINEVGNCGDSSKNNCNENADCIDIHPGRHFCTCKVGFIGDGFRCDGNNIFHILFLI